MFFSESGFPNDIHTFGLLSGIWSSSFALGAFLGPSIAGILSDLVGFQKGTYFEIFLHLILVSKIKLLIRRQKIYEFRPDRKKKTSKIRLNFSGNVDVIWRAIIMLIPQNIA